MILATVPNPFSGERTVFPTNGAGQLKYHLKKNKVGIPPHTIYTN